jgi:O-antigen ligase
MARHSTPLDRQSRFTLILLIVFLGAVFLFGGASRADVLSQPVARMAAVLMIVVAVMQLPADGWRRIRLPFAFLIALALVMIVQLIPLPPGIWASLPGHQLYAAAVSGNALPAVWRPISLTPDLTLNSLLALLPAAAALLGLAATRRADHEVLVPVVLMGIAASALVGLLQVASGRPYFYQITNEGSAVGFFSNRNHNAALIACALPLLACWGSQPHRDHAYERLRTWLGLCGAAAVFPLLLITGSRAGLVLGMVGILAAIPIALGGRGLARGRRPLTRRRALLLALPVLAGLAALGGAFFLSRDIALQRLFGGTTHELRTELLPVFVQMARDFFPLGSGFGSFDSVFRAYEPTGTLDFTYLNHAHNDPMELLIEGGLAGLVLIALLLSWYVIRSWRILAVRAASPADVMARTGAAVALILLLASIVDYPLRTPLLSVMMVIACFWMLPSGRRSRAAEGAESDSKGLAAEDA